MKAEKTMVLGRCIVILTMKKLCLFVLETKLETIAKKQFKQSEKSHDHGFSIIFSNKNRVIVPGLVQLITLLS